jgi:hypothetical protein
MPGGAKANHHLTCPACRDRFPNVKALFLCPDDRCRARDHPPDGVPDACRERPVFRANRYRHAVLCPYSSHRAYRKFCPSCGAELRLPLGSHQSIGIVGSVESGKTMFMTALVRQIRGRLARQTSLQMSLEWNEEDSRRYFVDLQRQIYDEHEVPESTKKTESLLSLSTTLRFTRQGWLRWLLGRDQGVVSLICPDPSGEFFRDHQEIYGLSYLGQAQALLLMVDPLTSPPFLERRRKAGEPYVAEIQSTTETLRVLARALREERGQPEGRLNKTLAVVLTKCDEGGVFDPDRPPYKGRFPVQGRTYDRRLAQDLGRRVVDHLESELEMSELVSLARQNFTTVEFFAVSALGRPPVRESETSPLCLIDPAPRRVEEPLLWVLHQWGYL